MKLLAIDPGNIKSAWVLYDTETKRALDKGIQLNEGLVTLISSGVALECICFDHLVIEMIKSYGMPMGDTCLMTCLWVGRFIQAWGFDYDLLPRKTIVAHICGSARAKDSNVRQALINRFVEAHGYEARPKDILKKGGPLNGFKRDLWAALAVAITWTERKEVEEVLK